MLPADVSGAWCWVRSRGCCGQAPAVCTWGWNPHLPCGKSPVPGEPDRNGCFSAACLGPEISGRAECPTRRSSRVGRGLGDHVGQPPCSSAADRWLGVQLGLASGHRGWGLPRRHRLGVPGRDMAMAREPACLHRPVFSDCVPAHFLWLQDALKRRPAQVCPVATEDWFSQHPCSPGCKTPGDHGMAAASQSSSFLWLHLVTEGLLQPKANSPKPRGCRSLQPIALAAPQGSSAAGKGQPEGSGEALGESEGVGTGRPLGQLSQPSYGL